MIADGLVAVRVRHIQDAWDTKKLLLGGADSLTGETEPHTVVGLNLSAVATKRKEWVEPSESFGKEMELGHQEDLAFRFPQYNPRPVPLQLQCTGNPGGLARVQGLLWGLRLCASSRFPGAVHRRIALRISSLTAHPFLTPSTPSGAVPYDLFTD